MSATRKSYQGIKDSPALSYISQMQVQSEEENEVPSNGEEVQSNDEEVQTAKTVNTEESADTPTETLEEILQKATEIEIPATPTGYRITAQYRELKTHRTQLVFPPSLFRKVKRRAKQLNISLNEFVCLILQAIVENDPEPKS